MKNKRVVMILQARMGSMRLPGKSLMLLAGKPLVVHVLDRVKKCRAIDEIVLATTIKPEDDQLVKVGKECGVSVFCGSENDLVDRYYQCAKQYYADVIVRVPADNVVPEPSVIDQTIQMHMINKNDFSTTYPNVFDNGYPDGIGCEVFNFESLERVWMTSTDPRNREHLHTNFYENRNIYQVGTFECPAEYRRPDIILDVNTEDEYRFMSELYNDLYQSKTMFTIKDVIEWYDNVYLPRQRGGEL